jgi:DNA-binding PadR family transcriptional regulator
METRGWLEASWAVSPKGRRAKYYRITAKGRRALARAHDGWKEYVRAVTRVVTGEGRA